MPRQILRDCRPITRTRVAALAAVAALALSACAGAPGPRPSAGPPTPLVIAHRGLPGLYPEEVLPGYEAAIAAGADALELDLQSSSDGVLFACHNVFLSDTTDVANHPEFAGRRTSREVDGVLTGPDWFISDFTAAELKTLRVRQPLAFRSHQYDGRYPMATFAEIVALAKQAMAAEPGRTVYVYPETKNPLYQRALGRPLEERLLAILQAAGWNRADAPVFVQSFDPESLKRLRRLGLQTKAVQLIDGSELDFGSGTMRYTTPDTARPFSWHAAGDRRTFAAMLTPAGLAEIRSYADGIGPWKLHLLPAAGRDREGRAVTALSAASSLPPTSLLTDAHRAGLFVHAYTFRDEPQYLSRNFGDDPYAEYEAYFRFGIDGVFTDFATTAVAARERWLATRPRSAAAAAGHAP